MKNNLAWFVENVHESIYRSLLPTAVKKKGFLKAYIIPSSEISKFLSQKRDKFLSSLPETSNMR
jgi:hypothetical protein